MYAYMRNVLHWLPLRQRIEFRVAVLVWYSLIIQAPVYTLLTFVALPVALGVPATFVRPPSCPICKHLHHAGPFPWLALWYGMVSHWLSGHLQECSPRNSFSNLKQHYL